MDTTTSPSAESPSTAETDPHELLRRAEAELEHLRVALASRETIGIAKGMLMLRYGLNEEQAFSYLSRTSQHNNVKLRDVAAQVIAELRSPIRPADR